LIDNMRSIAGIISAQEKTFGASCNTSVLYL
jgi:hypothetical protein